MAVFFNSRFLYRAGTTTYYWPKQGKSKGSTFQTFFLLLLLFLTLSMDHLKSRATGCGKKLLKVKGYIKGFKELLEMTCSSEWQNLLHC